MKKKKYYVDNNELENQWSTWLETGDSETWQQLQENIYKICCGVAVHFGPKDEEEHGELAHEAFLPTIKKICLGRLKFEPGRAPAFNLLTTTIFRHLYSKVNKDIRRKRILTEYRQKILQEEPTQT